MTDRDATLAGEGEETRGETATLRDPGMARLFLVVFTPFALGYLFSYFYRTVNAMISEDLTRDLGLGAADLGLLTAAYFVTFAAFQLPLGVLLDRYGPRRVHAVLLTVAALGAGLFSIANGMLALWIGRALIGFGVSAGLMAALKAFTLWFPQRRWPLINGLYMAMGGLGAVASTRPVEVLLQVTDWRSMFAGLAVLTLGAAALIFFIVPDKPAAGQAPSFREQAAGTVRIFRDPFFRRLAPAACLTMGITMAVQGLWAGPWMAEVLDFTRSEMAEGLLVLSLAITAGFVLTGWLGGALQRAGVPLEVSMGGGMAILCLAQGLIVMNVLGGSLLPWIVLGLTANVGTLGYSLLGLRFPLTHSARANTALNMLTFTTAFLSQFAMGGVIGLWMPDAAGNYPVAAYQTAFALFLAFQVLALIWYLRGVAGGVRAA